MNEYSLAQSEVKHLEMLCGLTDLWLYTTSITITWGKSALIPSISIDTKRKSWIIIKAKVGYLPEFKYEFNSIDITQEKALASSHYIKYFRGSKVLNRDLSNIDFERPYELNNISILNFTDIINPNGSISYDGALLFSFSDGRRFILASISALTSMLEFSTDKNQIDALLDRAVTNRVITK